MNNKNKVYNLAKRFKRKYSMTIAWNLKKHSKVVESVIDDDEKVLYAFCGQKDDSHQVIFDTCVVAITNKRIIVGQKRILWGYQITSITPELFNDLKIHVNLLFGKIEIDTVREHLFISNLDKKSLDEIETMFNKIVFKNKKCKKDNIDEN